MGILRMLGLMPIKVYDDYKFTATEARESLKRAHESDRQSYVDALAAANAEIAALRPDAEKWRAKQARDVEYGKAKRAKAQAVAKVKTGLAKRAAKKGAA